MVLNKLVKEVNRTDNSPLISIPWSKNSETYLSLTKKKYYSVDFGYSEFCLLFPTKNKIFKKSSNRFLLFSMKSNLNKKF